LISEGCIPLTEAESEAIDKLLDLHIVAATLTRRDPGESGPVLVHLGDATFVVDEDGTVTEQQ